MRKTLSEEQKAWFRTYFPKIENNRLAKAMGIGLDKLHEFAREMGLKKSESGIKAIQKRRAQKALKTNERNGCYDRKRGHPPSAATLEGLRKRWEHFHEGKGKSTYETLKERDPAKYTEIIEKRSQTQKKLFKSERRRIIYGLERKTKLINVILSPYKRSQIAHRYNALKRGYLLDIDCSEGKAGRYVIYYDNSTKRSEKFERNCIADGFIFMPDE